MNLRLEYIIPVPLKEFNHGATSIWGKTVEITSAQHVVLNATSGKGKSTFTGIMAGTRTDFEGELYLDQRSTKSYGLDEWSTLLRKHLSFVFQDLQLFPQLTVKENLLLKNKLTDFKTETEIKALLDKVGLLHRWEDRCGILSMGQQQRIAIIRALCQPFNWLILDEPFSHLDHENGHICLEMIAAEAKAQNAGFILTTLNPELRYSFDQEIYL